MIVIRAAEDMARALDSSLDPELHVLLDAHRERLKAYDGYNLQDLAIFIIVQPSDTLDAVERTFGERLVADAKFANVPELISRHRDWIEVVFILSDDGFGLVLFVSTAEGTDPNLLAACNRHLLRCS